MINILFVCMGNICRSPMAEAIFIDQAQKAGLSHHFAVDSAGTLGYHAGEPAYQGTRKVLQQHNIRYRGRSRKIKPADLSHFDYIIAMDSENILDLESLDMRGTYAHKIYKLLEFAGQTTAGDIPDPYYSGNFEYVYQLVLDGCQGLLDHIRSEHII